MCSRQILAKSTKRMVPTRHGMLIMRAPTRAKPTPAMTVVMPPVRPPFKKLFVWLLSLFLTLSACKRAYDVGDHVWSSGTKEECTRP